ncbi:unnamed protein product [Timema podura]|uniref:phospholipase A2 n=1 Tax=Timema podura TaxID=61482 RepID=A0ABN7NGS4_TIMPD|nr:unnamed protein product [Timema podura]
MDQEHRLRTYGYGVFVGAFRLIFEIEFPLISKNRPCVDTDRFDKLQKNGMFILSLEPSEENNRTKQNYESLMKRTRWCGAGNVARNNKDIGLFTDTDNCCKNHDSCDDIILAGKTKHELTNPSLFTRSNCKCDEEFYRCLKNVNTLISINIGALYFNKLKIMCFKYDHPRLSCKVKRGIRMVELKPSVPKFVWWEMEKHFGKTTLSTPDQDSDQFFPVIGSQVYSESSALDLAATEAGPKPTSLEQGLAGSERAVVPSSLSAAACCGGSRWLQFDGIVCHLSSKTMCCRLPSQTDQFQRSPEKAQGGCVSSSSRGSCLGISAKFQVRCSYKMAVEGNCLGSEEWLESKLMATLSSTGSHNVSVAHLGRVSLVGHQQMTNETSGTFFENDDQPKCSGKYRSKATEFDIFSTSKNQNEPSTSTGSAIQNEEQAISKIKIRKRNTSVEVADARSKLITGMARLPIVFQRYALRIRTLKDGFTKQLQFVTSYKQIPTFQQPPPVAVELLWAQVLAAYPTIN